MKQYVIIHALAFAAGALIDCIIPDPHTAFHPIRIIGTLINTLEKALYGKSRGKDQILRGAVLFFGVIFITGAVTAVITIGAYYINPCLGGLTEAIETYFILACASLRHESMKVYRAVDENASSLDEARRCLSMIVGRDTDSLDEAGIFRATVETVAENTSDGVIAPMLYTALFGPFGGFVYKAVNTMDSMLGYHNERYKYFGKVPAVADDVLNFIPSRVSAFLMMFSAFVLGFFSKDYDAKRGFYTWKRDRRKHKSPNSAQTESACAGILGIRLGGKAAYAGRIVERPYLGDEIRPIEKKDIVRTVILMYGGALTAVAAMLVVLFTVV
ncbi:MAG: adenosylcobinamide-phosphate synthase CbiB [Lachnospiraceae bacterium]|nr:adenosylcobinamide-phosphate synthase CbiB [Lachnospiraceae bacterium]